MTLHTADHIRSSAFRALCLEVCRYVCLSKCIHGRLLILYLSASTSSGYAISSNWALHTPYGQEHVTIALSIASVSLLARSLRPLPQLRRYGLSGQEDGPPLEDQSSTTRHYGPGCAVCRHCCPLPRPGSWALEPRVGFSLYSDGLVRLQFYQLSNVDLKHLVLLKDGNGA